MKIKLNGNGKRIYSTDSVRYLRVKIDSKSNWKSQVNTIATKLNQPNVMRYKIRYFVNANILKSMYLHYLNDTLTVFASYGDKTAQLTVSSFSRKRNSQLSISKNIILTHLLCFITIKLSKMQIKSRWRTLSS